MNRPPHPPGLFLRFLRWFCRPDLVKYIEGDLVELFEENVKTRGAQKAKWKFTWDVVRLFRPSLMKSLSGHKRLNHYGMFKNHLKIAFRIFRREKFFTAINIIGLACGVWCTLLTYYWIRDEYSFDRFHENGDQLYRMMMKVDVNGTTYTEESTAYPLGDVLIEDFPEVVDRVRYSYDELVAVTLNGQLSEQSFASADPNFFQVFSIPMTQGSAENCLKDLKSIVISEKLAKEYFKGDSPVGERITIHHGPHDLEFLVTGVFEDIPKNSSVRFDMLIPIDNLLSFNENMESWGNTWFATYIRIDPQTDLKVFSEKIRELPKAKAGVEWYDLIMQKYEDQYLYDRFVNGKQAGGRIDNLILFALVAIFTLLIACFNYINLTTARAIRRDKEIGIRKTLGANKGVLILQFLIESGLIISGAILISIIGVYVVLPFFNAVTGKSIVIDYLDPQFYFLLSGVFLATLGVSGVYPAVTLSKSGWNLISKIKSTGSQSLLIRRSLVGLQFCLSILLVSGAFIVYQQLTYLSEKDLGLDQENIVYLELDQHSQSKYKEIKGALESHSSILGVSGSSHNFIGPLGYTGDVNWRLKPSNGDEFFFGIQDIDRGMLELLDVNLKDGTSFSDDLNPDSTHYIINEVAAEILGFEQPLGEQLSFWGMKGEVVGIAENFHFASLHETIQPLIIRDVLNTEYVFIKVASGHTKEALSYVEKVHEEFSDFPVKYHFLDREIEGKYREELIMQRLAYSFSILALIISGLGLIGLVSYSIERRIKEIAVRKVLGASLSNLGQLLFKEYFWLIVVASVIAVPVVIYWTDQWLDNYPYRIDLSFGTILFSLIVLLTISALIIGVYLRKIRSTNPATTLRDE